MQKRKKQDWDFFFCTLAGKPASIRFDLSLLEAIPLATHSQLVYLIVPINKSNNQGMIHEEEASYIREVEADVVRLLSGDLKGIFAMRYTGKGRRAFYFYLPPRLEVAELLTTCLRGNGIQTFSLGILADPQWRFFRANIKEEWIAGKYEELPYQMVGQGEAFPQEIEHELCFPSEGTRKQFMEIIQQKNFAISQLKYSASHPDFPYSLYMSRMEWNSLQQLNDLKESLQLLVQQFGGTYLSCQALTIGK